MIRPDIRRLFKYRSFDAFSLISLIDHTGWLATPPTFNDPFDCAITLSDEKLDESLQEILREIEADESSDRVFSDDERKVTDADREAYRLLQRRIAETAQSVGIFCLTEVCDHILMWSHYADSHRGFCVEYERDEENTLGRLALPVVYSNDYPDLALHAVTSSSENEFPSDILWLTKSLHWEYEKEWRIMQGHGDKAYDVDFPITGIIFGMRMPDSQRRTIFNLVSGRWDANFREAVRSQHRFELTLEPWSPPKQI